MIWERRARWRGLQALKKHSDGEWLQVLLLIWAIVKSN